MLVQSFEELITFNEGCRLKAYRDNYKGVWTIGYGCTGPNIVEGTVWTQQEAELQRHFRCLLAEGQASKIVGLAWLRLEDPRRAAVSDMCYQMGEGGLKEFQHMLQSINLLDWTTASVNILASKYARETPERAKRNAEMILTGEWPYV